jgi:TRAP-type C4-dicarboxylate transport system permease small subunit
MHLTKKIGIFATITSSVAPLAVRAAYGLEETAGAAGIGTTPNQLPVFIGRIVSAALGLVGVIFLLLMVYGGYLWMIARGDKGTLDNAKNTISRAIIGLIIVAGAYAITTFVVGAFSKQ